MDDTNIIELFQSELFIRMLDERIQRGRTMSRDTSQPSKELTQQNRNVLLSELIAQLSQQLEHVINYNVQSCCAEMLNNLEGKMKDIQTYIEELKNNRVGKALSGSAATKNPAQELDAFQQSLEQEKIRLEEDGQAEVTKIRREVEAIRDALLKYSRQGNEKLQELHKDLQQSPSTHHHFPSLAQLDNSVNISESRYTQLQRQIKHIQDQIDSRQLDGGHSEKYEAGFKSLWNVVTMMENSLAETKKNLIARIEALSNKPEKIGLINSFFK